MAAPTHCLRVPKCVVYCTGEYTPSCFSPPPPKDRLYVVTCGKAGFQNSRSEVSVVQLKVANGGRKLTTVLEGSSYSLRAEVLNHDPEFGILVKRCFAFDDADTFIQLVDDRGCRAQKLISEFTYDDAAGTADATIYSMFRWVPFLGTSCF